MNAKSLILLLSAISYIVHGSWGIFVVESSAEESAKTQRVKNDVNYSKETIEEPPDHEIPYSSHENPKEVATKPKYIAPGEWAKPSKEKNVDLEFIPTKLYAQVRGTHTVKHAPREEAINDAKTDEEKLNALRLREVVKNTKINTVYTEEGYEDSAYDHAGHIRDADFHEGFARKLRDRLKQKQEENAKGTLEESADYEDDYSENDGQANSKDNYEDPESIVRNEIEVLVEDVEKNDEEAEKASEINLFDSKRLKDPKEKENVSQDTKIIKNAEVKYETTTSNPVEETTTDRTFQSSNDNPTTISYGRVFWDFFKTKTDESTTPSPFWYQPISISTMTLTVPGSYFFSTQQETTTPSSIFPASQTYHPQGLDSNLVNTGLITSISQNNDQAWPLQTFNYVGRMDNPTGLLDPKESGEPLTQSTFNNSILNNLQNNETGSTILPQKAEINQNDSNDYSDNPLVQDTSIKLDPKKKYRVLVRHKPQTPTRTSKSHQPPDKTHFNDLPYQMTDYNKLLNDQREKYLKVLNYVTNQDASRPKEVRYYDFDRPSVPIESETTIREPLSKKLPRNGAISNIDDFLRTSSLPIYKIDPFPLLDLSPPPLPTSRYNNRNKHRPLSPIYDNKRQSNIQQILKYAPVIVDLTRKSRARRKRSMEYVKGDRNTSSTNRGTRKWDYDKTVEITKDGGRNSRLAEESNVGDIRESYYDRFEKDLGGKRTHEELLDQSPRVSGSVIDKEIEERFDKGKDEEKLEKNVEVEVPGFDYVEFADEKEEKQSSSTEITPDVKKYPFYINERIEDLSGLKYAVDPKKVPRKTATGMEFYESRDQYKDCEEVEENLDEVLPKEEHPSAAPGGPDENGPRLRDLGDKLDCFKAKYFDENPFDNPLFIEKNVGDPNLPKELDPKELSKRILVLPDAKEDFIFQKLSRKPEERRKYTDDQFEQNKRPLRPYSTRNSQGHQKTPKRQQRKERVASLLNLSTEPYHKQVYEDVMNHITGSNDPYRVYGVTTVKPVGQVKLAASATNLETINTTIPIAVGFYDNNTEIDGLLPPKDPNDFLRQNNPGAKRIIRINRRRLPRYYLPRPIARYHAIKIQKRSIDQPKRVLQTDDLIAEESDVIPVTLRPRRRKFSIASRNSSSALKSMMGDTVDEPSSKIIYTIRDRIRHSRPKDEIRNVGKFTAIQLDEDTRRKEPRYNNIRRKPSDSSTVPTILSTIWTEQSVIKESTTPDSNKRLEYATLSRGESRKNLDEDSMEESNKYEVHETVDDETLTTSLPIISTSSDYTNLMEYLNSDAPGYKEAFSEDTTDVPIINNTPSKEPNEDLKETSKESEGTSNEDTQQSYESNEEVSEKNEDEQDDNHEDSSSEEESKEEDRTFFHYSSRPYSPSENYEDEKYSDLGKRINKPAFYHPPFSMLESEEDVEDEEDSAENKKNSRLLPWSDEKDEKSFGETKYYSRPFWSYEYPWEKRERLARRERKKRRKNYGGFGDFHSKDSDEDVSSSKHTGSRVYPWDLYDVPSRKSRKTKRERYFDADGSGSEHKPVKYSSKYNSSSLGSISSLNNPNLFDLKKNTKQRSESSKESNKSSNTRLLNETLVPEVITQSPKKDDNGRRKVKTDERNSTEVASVATIELKKRKNVTRKETQHEEANSTMRSPPTSSMENTNKSNITMDGSRRRRILKKYSPSDVIDKDNSREQVKRKRGKIRSTTIAPSTTISSSTKSSRRRPQFVISKTSAPTPSTTTVEHRSRVSKESFVSRTTYPANSTTLINDNPETFGKKTNEPGNVTSENVERISVMTKETPDHVYQTKKIDKDGVKEMFVSITPNKAGKNVSKLESDSSEFEDEENRWKIPQVESEDLSDIPSTEVSFQGQDGIVRLTEHSSSNIRSSVSWISENYDYR